MFVALPEGSNVPLNVDVLLPIVSLAVKYPVNRRLKIEKARTGRGEGVGLRGETGIGSARERRESEHGAVKAGAAEAGRPVEISVGALDEGRIGDAAVDVTEKTAQGVEHAIGVHLKQRAVVVTRRGRSCRKTNRLGLAGGTSWAACRPTRRNGIAW